MEAVSELLRTVDFMTRNKTVLASKKSKVRRVPCQQTCAAAAKAETPGNGFRVLVSLYYKATYYTRGCRDTWSDLLRACAGQVAALRRGSQNCCSCMHGQYASVVVA